MKRWLAFAGLLGVLVLTLGAAPALAYYEPTSGALGGGPSNCGCHSSSWPVGTPSCQHCHGYIGDNSFPLGERNGADVLQGPHGNYTNSTNKCESCHAVHDADAPQLLPAATVVGTCFTCHDGTGGFGVYGTIKARTGLDPKTDLTLGSHRIDVTNLIPGGDAATGGGSTRTFDSASGFLGCGDCHSVHASGVVTAYQSDRKRTRTYEVPDRPTTKLLRQQPTGAATPVAEYGSDWCLGCHSGRVSGMALKNHPVDSLATTTTPFVVRSVAGGRTLGISTVGFRHIDPTKSATGNGHGDFLMAEPRTAEQGAHAPICQQCHEDSRNVGDLNASGVPVVVALNREYADGLSATGNPRFQSFPHETENDFLVIEEYDDLCMNCHTPPS